MNDQRNQLSWFVRLCIHESLHIVTREWPASDPRSLPSSPRPLEPTKTQGTQHSTTLLTVAVASFSSPWQNSTVEAKYQRTRRKTLSLSLLHSLSLSLSFSPSLTHSLQKSFLFLVCVRVSCPKDHSSFSSSLHQHIYPFKLHFPFPKQRFISQFLSQILLFTYFLLGGKQVSFHHLPCLASNPFIIDHMFIHS